MMKIAKGQLYKSGWLVGWLLCVMLSGGVIGSLLCYPSFDDHITGECGTEVSSVIAPAGAASQRYNTSKAQAKRRGQVQNALHTSTSKLDSREGAP